MARTTIDIDTVILREIRSLQQKEGRSLGRIISELLAEALARRQTRMPDPQLKWVSRPMRARVDLSDKEAVYALLDPDER
jgi:hypothetical protein